MNFLNFFLFLKKLWKWKKWKINKNIGQEDAKTVKVLLLLLLQSFIPRGEKEGSKNVSKYAWLYYLTLLSDLTLINWRDGMLLKFWTNLEVQIVVESVNSGKCYIKIEKQIGFINMSQKCKHKVLVITWNFGKKDKNKKLSWKNGFEKSDKNRKVDSQDTLLCCYNIWKELGKWRGLTKMVAMRAPTIQISRSGTMCWNHRKTFL
jgi:hypothetical protein